MKIGVVTETLANECRVAVSPFSIKQLVQQGFDVQVHEGAGVRSYFSDEEYRDVGATIVASAEVVWRTSDILLKVAPPSIVEASMLRDGAVLVGFLGPGKNSELLEILRAKGVSSIAMECIPRISRAQKMDALSSMTNIAGYRAIVEAANVYPGFFAGQITAAGKVPPAKVLVIGAGVAGLAAIGAARGLGAIVRAFDTRSAVKEQVQSMGAEFLELAFDEDGDGAGGYAKEMSPAFIEAEMALFASQAKECDIIVTTAIIPNKPAPKLITRPMVESMKPGSVIVDMAAEQGGNCELTEPGKRVERNGVQILGFTDLVSRMASRASSMYANNLVNLLLCLNPSKNGTVSFDLEDDIVRGSLVTHQSQLRWPLPKIQTSVQPSVSKSPSDTKPGAENLQGATAKGASDPASVRSQWLRPIGTCVGLGIGIFFLWAIAAYAPEKLVTHLTVFVLSCFLGWQVVWSVTPALHTPLMSVTNAISGIILVGAMLQMKEPIMGISSLLAAAAVLIATINIAGGFFVTSRMLKMFHKGE